MILTAILAAGCLVVMGWALHRIDPWDRDARWWTPAPGTAPADRGKRGDYIPIPGLSLEEAWRTIYEEMHADLLRTLQPRKNWRLERGDEA